jgi:predicted dehydrogenase
MAQANLGFNNPFNPHHRLFNLELGGGALLDLGIYPLSLISMIFGGKKPADIQSRLFFGKSGADEEDAVILSYGGPRIAYAASSFTAQLENDAWIYGTRGRIYIPNFVWSRGVKLLLDGKDEYHFQPEFISNGYNYEAEEVMLCIREGKTESAVMPLDESLVITETMDAIRGQWNFRYPGEKESGDRQKPLCGP